MGGIDEPRPERVTRAESSLDPPHDASTVRERPNGSASLALPQPLSSLAFEGQRAQVFDALFERAVHPQTFGRYVILDSLGEGGMGIVLRAFDRELDRPIALKVLREDLDEQYSARLRREAQAMAKLSHPNVVQVYEVGQVQGRTFVAMELIKGKSADQWIKQQPRPGWRSCVEMFMQLGQGLAAAHTKGLVHRDFKPSNAIIDQEGRARVLDFGLARSGHEGPSGDCPRPESWPESEPLELGALETSLTRTGAILGTPAYMPLEQIIGLEADPRSDQFSFCVSLYEAVYGERPFKGRTLCELAFALEAGEVRPAPPGNNAPVALRTALLRGLSSAPDERWPSMNALLEELERVVLEHVEPADALPVFERALTLCTTYGVDPALLATTRFVLARALWATPARHDDEGVGSPGPADQAGPTFAELGDTEHDGRPDQAANLHTMHPDSERDGPSGAAAADLRWQETFGETDAWLTRPRAPASRRVASADASPRRTIRRFVDLTEHADEQLHALQRKTGAASLSEVICRALATYERCIEHRLE